MEKREHIGSNFRLKFTSLDRYALWGVLFIVPTIIYFAIFRITPIAYSLVVSFTRWDLVTEMEYVGFSNYAKAFSDPKFILSLQNTFVYAFGVLVFVLLISLALAVLFDQELGFRNWYRAAYFLPTVISWVVISVIWKTMYNPSVGLISYATDFLGLKPINVLTSTQFALPGIMVMGVWQGIGFYLVIFLAGLQAIDPNIYEAAVIDGARPFKKFWHITIPLLKPILLFALVMGTIQTLRVFPQVYVMTRGGPAESTSVAVYHIYRTAFYLQEMGYASALALILLVMILLITLLYLKFIKTERYYT